MYKILPTCIFRISDSAYIPIDEDNRDYREYLQWVALGNIPNPYVALPTPIPAAITMRQARLALLDAGKLSSIDTAIDSLPSPQKERAQIEWQYSNEVQRENGVVSMIAPMLGLSETDIDALFISAAQL